MAWVVALAVTLTWALVVTVLWVREMKPDGPQWGSVAEWFSGIVSLLALSAAIWAARAAYGQMRIMQDDAARRRQEAREHQARLVTVTVEQGKDVDGQLGSIVVVHNRSREPIRDVFASFTAPGYQTGFVVNTIPADKSVVCGGSSKIVQRARQGVLAQIPADFRDMVDDLMSFGYGVMFTDAKGVQWQRMPDSSLVERPREFTVQQATEAAAALYHRRPTAR